MKLSQRGIACTFELHIHLFLSNVYIFKNSASNSNNEYEDKLLEEMDLNLKPRYQALSGLPA